LAVAFSRLDQTVELSVSASYRALGMLLSSQFSRLITKSLIARSAALLSIGK
jgi:hypothetical protein